MLDLYIACGVIWGISLLIFVATVRLARRMAVFGQNLLATSILLAGISYLFWFRDGTWLASVLPHSALIVLGSWGSIFCAALAAVAFNSLSNHRCRRIWPVLTLVIAGGYSTVQPLLGQVPNCNNEWTDDVCLQSTSYSCTAASAATLLHHFSIPASEAEMAELCLTRKGTIWQGLYRGLHLKCAGSQFSPEVLTVSTDQLLLMQFPVVISVGIPKSADVDPIYSEQYGWPPGQLHSVVLFGRKSDDLVEIGDPGVGRENWSVDELRVLFRGTATRLKTHSGNIGRPLRG